MVEFIQDFNRNVIKNLHKSIKLCQTEFINKTEVATESNNVVAVMCKEWENVFLYGIKRRLNKSFFSLKSSEMPTSIINQINPFSNQTNCTLWSFLCEFLAPEEIIRFTQSLNKIDTDIGRCRAWLRAAINEQTLELLLTKVLCQQGQAIVKVYYDCYAVLLDVEENTVLPSMAAGLGSIWFALELNNDQFNLNIETNRRFSLDSRSQNTSESSLSFYRPLLFSSSTSGSFEEVEIKETQQKCQDNEVPQNAKSKGKSRLISIAPIEDDDDSKSDSSDIYSPFNLLKSGLNLVSKFHFGGEERLSDIKEQDNQSTNNVGGLINNKKTHLMDCGLRECDETEFHDCCLSLQNDFYSSEGDDSINYQKDNISTQNVSYITANLVVDSSILPLSFEKSSRHSEDQSQSLDSNASNDNQPNDINHEEIMKLRQKLQSIMNENSLLKNQIDTLKFDNKIREDEAKSELMKIMRENELLKKRLKTYLFRDDSSANKYNNNNKSDDFCDNVAKMDQLIQMHADLIELNDQLQRSLVDKDIKLGMLQSKVAKFMYDEEEVGVHIEHFGTVYIRISDYFICGQGSKKYLSYKISISCWPISTILVKQNSEWITYRRFKEFHKFYIETVNKYPVLRNISFPSKWVYKANEDQLIERRKGLELFLRTVVTFLLQQWVKDNEMDIHNHILSDVQSDHSGISLVGQDSDNLPSSQIDSRNISIIYSKKEAKEIITNIIPFLVPSLNE